MFMGVHESMSYPQSRFDLRHSCARTHTFMYVETNACLCMLCVSSTWVVYMWKRSFERMPSLNIRHALADLQLYSADPSVHAQQRILNKKNKRPRGAKKGAGAKAEGGGSREVCVCGLDSLVSSLNMWWWYLFTLITFFYIISTFLHTTFFYVVRFLRSHFSTVLHATFFYVVTFLCIHFLYSHFSL